MSGRDDWRRGYEAAPVGRALPLSTSSGIPLEPVYGPDEGEWPGVFPYTRGPYASMYRSKLWTHRMFAGFGSAADSNQRIRALLDAGGDGLSIAFDLPTLMGRDSDDPLSAGEVGRCGVAVDTLADMEELFAGIDLGRVSTSMTINSPAAVVLAMYVVAAEKAGVPRDALRGTLQNDILKEYQAENEYLFPPRPSVRLVTDVVAWCTAEMPLWHPLSVSGYHIREAGSTAVQELAFTLANGFAYVEAAVATGLAVDAFAPRLSFFFNADIDFFEEIAKFRAARRLWPAGCGTATVPSTSDRCAAASTSRRQGRRSQRSNRRSTWCARRWRRWPGSWAGPRACTPTPSTRPSTCPPTPRRGWPCAPSR